MTISAPHATSASHLPGVASKKDETMEEVRAGAPAGLPSERPRQDGTEAYRSVVVSGTRTCSTWTRDERALYFIENPALGLIKIGITGFDVEQRRLTLERACGVPLRILRVIPEAAGWEQDVLAAFDDARALGEWFRESPALLELIANPGSLVEVIAYAWPQISALRGQALSARHPQHRRDRALSRSVVTGMVTA